MIKQIIIASKDLLERDDFQHSSDKEVHMSFCEWCGYDPFLSPHWPMTYIIQEQRMIIKGDDEYIMWWDSIDWFEDKELAEKELRNLNRSWVASANFRLIKHGT